MLRRPAAALVLVALLAAPAAAEPRPRPWYGDTLGDVLVAGGTGALILGGVLALSASTDVAKADQGAPGGVSLDAYHRLADSADRKQLWAGIAAGAGAALIAGGVVRFLTADRAPVAIEPALSPDGAAVHARWRF